MIHAFTVLLIFLIMGVPVAFAVGTSGMVSLLLNTHFPLIHIVQLPLTQVQSISMLAIPLFILVGNLMSDGGTAERLVSLVALLTGRVRGGLAQASVVLSTLMGGIFGSATTDVVVGVRPLGPDMIKNGYSKEFSVNVFTFTSLTTATIPPGVGPITYGTIDSVSIRKLLSADIFVDLYMMIVLIASVVVTARMRGYKPVRQDRTTWKETDISLEETVWVVMFPVTPLAGIRMEFFSPSEVGASAYFYSIFIGTFIYRRLTIKSFTTVLRDGTADIGSITVIVFLTVLFGYGIPIDKIPQKMATLITGIITNSSLVPILIIILPVFVGMFMEGSVVILLLTPIPPPIRQSVGIDPVHLGLLMCATVTTGVNAPSVGMSIYMVNTTLDCSPQEYTKFMIPFLAAVPLAIRLPVFLPDIALFLPRLLY